MKASLATSCDIQPGVLSRTQSIDSVYTVINTVSFSLRSIRLNSHLVICVKVLWRREGVVAGAGSRSRLDNQLLTS